MAFKNLAAHLKTVHDTLVHRGMNVFKWRRTGPNIIKRLSAYLGA